MEPKNCHICGVKEGEIHKFGCEIELCPFCGHQIISCMCIYEYLHIEESKEPTDKETEQWIEIIEQKGRIPYQIEIDNLIDAIAYYKGFDINESTHNRIVKKLLNTFNIDHNKILDEFINIYLIALIEYGIGKSNQILEFFKNENIQKIFYHSYNENDPVILLNKSDSILLWEKLQDEMPELGIDLRREFAIFSAIFNEIVDRARISTEIKNSKKFKDIYGDLNQIIWRIINRLDKIDSHKEIWKENFNLAQSYKARQFIVTPTDQKLKVFISSTMAELRDVREIVDNSLDDGKINAWVYEAHAGARPESIIETSLKEVEAADIFVGLFWRKHGEVTMQEYHHARHLGKPCFIYIRDKNILREEELEKFLRTEIYELNQGITYDYFDSAIKLGKQVAEDTLSWLIRRHREMTAEIQEAHISNTEIANLQEKVNHFQSASRKRLPKGNATDFLAQQMRNWFETLGYRFESYEEKNDDFFEWIINIPARRGYDRILVRGIKGEAEIKDVMALRRVVDKQKTNEGWLVAARRKSQAACDKVNINENSDLFCYTFDELLDEVADFDAYFKKLETEVKQRDINRMYIPLACTKDEFNPITVDKIGESCYDENNGWIDGYIDSWLDDPGKEHISILGEFGTGKTWFAMHYAFITMQRYLYAKERNIARPRLPILIPLRDYAKAISVESLFSEFFFRKHEIPLPGYSAFEQLNKMGKLLLIFDGFDEMAAKVDRQKMINNFWELAQVVIPGSKVILTCRTEHFPEAHEGRALLNAELQASTSKLSGEAPQFEVLELKKFEKSQIYKVLSLQANSATVEKIMDNSQLLDLAQRPLMTEFILEALPDIEADKPIDLSRIYLYATKHKMNRDIKNERTFTSLADKLYFLCELSWEMLSNDQMSLNYRLFPDRLRRLFGNAVEEKKDLDHWHFDMMGQTMLIRNADGDYMPAHRSLLEFFVAYKFAAELGILASDFIELAQAQSNIDSTSMPKNYTWTEYFKREFDDENTVNLIPPIKNFITEDIINLKETLGKNPLTGALLNLIQNMLNKENKTKEQLLKLITEIKGKSAEDVGFIGGNVATLIVRFDPKALINQDLSNVILDSADLSNCDLTGCNFKGASLRYANLNNTLLENANIEGADMYKSNLSNTRLEGANLKNTKLEEANLIGVNLMRASLEGVFLLKTNLKKANLEETNLTDTYFEEVDFGEAKLKKAKASKSKFINVNLKNANLEKIDLHKAKIIESNLSGINLENSNLTELEIINSNLTEANLFRSDLKEAILINLDFEVADLSESDLTEIYINYCNFWGANIVKAKLINAHLENSDLSSTDLRGTDLYAAKLNNVDLWGTDWG